MLKFDELVSKTYPMEDIQQVFDDMPHERRDKGAGGIGVNLVLGADLLEAAVAHERENPSHRTSPQ